MKRRARIVRLSKLRRFGRAHGWTSAREYNRRLALHRYFIYSDSEATP